MGLVNRVVPSDRLLDEARSYVTGLAETCSPTSMAIIKRQVYEDWMHSLLESSADADEKMLTSFRSRDFAEGIAALFEKRPPVFNRIGKNIE